MLAYSLRLSLHGIVRHLWLSVLVCAALAIGVAGAMSVYTVYHTMSSDPIPTKSSQLFAVQLDSWGPHDRRQNGEPSDQLNYRDATGLLQSSEFTQAAMYRTRGTTVPQSANRGPIEVSVRATGRDFFNMFDPSFRQGGAWLETDEQARANVVVVSSDLSRRVFAREDSVGETLLIDARAYRIVGVLDDWNPAPRFYDLGPNTMAAAEDVFMPLTTAIDREMPPSGQVSCKHQPAPQEGWLGFLNSDCTWLQFWAELRDREELQRYERWVSRYAQQQRETGRYNWEPYTRVRDVKQWLEYKGAVPNEIRAITAVGFGFLVVCLINAVSLMLVKLSTLTHDIAIRRALGASNAHIFAQCLLETVLIGVVAAVVGLLLTTLAVSMIREIVPRDLARVTEVDPAIAGITIFSAICSAIVAGLYPAWRSSRQEPATLLKAR